MTNHHDLTAGPCPHCDESQWTTITCTEHDPREWPACYRHRCSLMIESELAAMTKRAEDARRDAESLRKDLCEIADGCGVGVPDRTEAKRRIIAIRTELLAAQAVLLELARVRTFCPMCGGDNLPDKPAVHVDGCALAKALGGGR